jgi:hypothetical protein
MKYYFGATDSEMCHTIDYFYEQMEELKIPQLQIYPAIQLKGKPFFWCSILCECGERGENICGKLNCTHYKPRNGKNGRCVHHKNCYAPSDISETIYRKTNQNK